MIMLTSATSRDREAALGRARLFLLKLLGGGPSGGRGRRSARATPAVQLVQKESIALKF